MELRLRFGLPATFTVASATKAAALENGKWENLGRIAQCSPEDATHYRAGEQSGEIDCWRYPPLVVHPNYPPRIRVDEELATGREFIVCEGCTISQPHAVS